MSVNKPKTDINEIKEEIKTNWFWYKVCNGCDGVALYSDTFCPKCRGYNFDENRKRIIDEIIRQYKRKLKLDTDSKAEEYSD